MCVFIVLLTYFIRLRLKTAAKLKSYWTATSSLSSEHLRLIQAADACSVDFPHTNIAEARRSRDRSEGTVTVWRLAAKV